MNLYKNYNEQRGNELYRRYENNNIVELHKNIIRKIEEKNNIKEVIIKVEESIKEAIEGALNKI